MNTVLILAAITGATVAGDYLIKLASGRESGLLTPAFLAGALLYGLPAIGWFFLMRNHSLAAAAVLYSASTILLMTALGTLVFREAFGVREAAGVALAVASVVVMTREA